MMTFPFKEDFLFLGMNAYSISKKVGKPENPDKYCR